MRKKGRIVYVPPVVLEEIDSIKKEHDIVKGKNSTAFRKLVEFGRVGREVEKMRNSIMLKDLFKKKK